MLRSAVKDAGISADLLDLEFTETMLLEDADDETEKTLHALRDSGVRLVLDDFGTGHLALSSLRRLPLDALKVDRIFIRDVRENPRDRALLGALTELAHALSLSVIAEGVETDPQRDLLREMGCDAYQGFLFCPPVAPAHIEALIAPDYVRSGGAVLTTGEAAARHRSRWAALGEIETAAAAAAERRASSVIPAAHPLLRPQFPVGRGRPGSHRRPLGSSE
jgi:predicted signal transduction protein with EAL and GGDEF domain